MFRTLKIKYDTDTTFLQTHRVLQDADENNAPRFVFGIWGTLFDTTNYGINSYYLYWGGAGAWLVRNCSTDLVVATCLLEDQSPTQLPYSVFEDWQFSEDLEFRFLDFEVIEDIELICGFELWTKRKDEEPLLADIKVVSSFQYGPVFSFEYPGIGELIIAQLAIGSDLYTMVDPNNTNNRYAITDIGQTYYPVDADWEEIPLPGEETTFFEEVYSSLIACPTYFEDRTKKEFSSFKLPASFTEQNRGAQECCCKHLVLASRTTKTWETDKTSMWFKKALNTDIVSFKIYKDGVELVYDGMASISMPNDPLAIYVTVDWYAVSEEFGFGCYELGIEYNTAGLTGTIEWGHYDLKPYSVENAMGTARLRAIFNGYHEADGIDFTGANVESCIRFNGFAGRRQPNMETDNIIYSDRQMNRVIRENLNTYEVITDPLNECIIKPITDVFLLSENQLFLSDYNYHNHSYRYQDIPVIVQESANIEYYDWSRLAKLTVTLGDKFKNQRTYYK